MTKTKRPHLHLTYACAFLLLFDLSAHLRGQQADEATIRRYSQEAEKALAEKKTEAAAKALEKLAQLTPRVPEVHGNLGMVYYTQGRYHEAAAAFQRALKLNPQMATASLMLGICYAEVGRPKDSVPLLEPAFRNPPDSEIGRVIGLELQRSYLALDQMERAVEVSEELLNRYPNDPEILYRTSHLHGDRALKIMLRLVEVAPNSPWKRMAFGEVQEAQKRYDLAIIEYQNAIKMDPRLPGPHFRLGRAILLNARDKEAARDEALLAFQQELAIDPNHSSSEYEIGEIYRARGQLEKAQEHFLRAIQLHPQFEDAQIALARTLISLNEHREALPHLLAAIQLDATNETSHFLLAGVYRTLGNTANYQHELELYQKYHVRPYAGESRAARELPTALSTPEVTKQTLDADMPRQP